MLLRRTFRMEMRVPGPSSGLFACVLALLATCIGMSAAGPARADTKSHPGTADASLGAPFSTRFAHFQPVPFQAIPGWEKDNLLEGLAAFRRGCSVLSGRKAWSDTCAALHTSDADSSEAARRFFQRHFHAYQVRGVDENPTGLINGYYAPLLEGRRQPDARFRFPVYGRPHDLYLLDSPAVTGMPRQWFVVDGDHLRGAAEGAPGAHEYAVDLGQVQPGMADKRYRVRIDGQTVRPYWTRQQIDRTHIDAPVIAWVDDAWALYAMQLQGTGRIRLDDGSVLRLTHDGQNGRPFLPRAGSNEAALLADAIKTRGLDDHTPAQAHQENQSVAAIIARLQSAPDRAGTESTSDTQQQTATPRSDDESTQAIIERLQREAAAAPAKPAAGHADDPEVQAMIRELTANGARPGVGTPRPGGSKPVPAIADPGYVFFRVVPEGTRGTPGALGVPLTPGRSLAVDPRITPLGAPVFVETAQPRADGDIRRLMVAQDTGETIRGSVRGDFYWGDGADAEAMVSAMNASGRMWLLLPKSLHPGAAPVHMHLRGLDRPAPAPDCVIADGDHCVD